MVHHFNHRVMHFNTDAKYLVNLCKILSQFVQNSSTFQQIVWHLWIRTNMQNILTFVNKNKRAKYIDNVQNSEQSDTMYRQLYNRFNQFNIKTNAILTTCNSFKIYEYNLLGPKYLLELFQTRKTLLYHSTTRIMIHF